ncbi:putative BOI-related E3 ubiquitin-protein ligase 3 [Nymphaea thermarum]|nr:putative BOI-related E3 ubiquitin-protein ligase 3 [Nymphaea thermarum]
MAVLEGTIVKKLKQKELKIESIGKVNCALEERVRSLCIENQIWQNLARSNEATSNALRSNLEQVLAQANEGHGDSKEDAGAAESCCCNNNNNKSAEEEDDHLAGNGEWSIPVRNYELFDGWNP